MEGILKRYRTILLFGMPGSGKGTQGMVLGQLPFFVHISMGEVMRKLPKYGTLGGHVVDYTSQGKMVPDDLTVQIYQRHIQVLEMQELITHDRHILILDGIPRNYVQAERLDPFLDVIQIFHLKISNLADAMERLKVRALRENRLDDINEDVIRRRLRIYHEETKTTLSFYDKSIVYDVEASQSPLMVLQDIINRLAELQASSQVKGLDEL
jgi:adenylate kinase